MKSRKRIKVVCAIIERGDTVLAARRKTGDSNGGLWEFPGGKIKGAETPQEALHREIIEELGVRITILRQLPAINWDYPDKSIELFPFVCTIADDSVPLPLDHEQIGFFIVKEALCLDWAQADRMIIDRYMMDRNLFDNINREKA